MPTFQVPTYMEARVAAGHAVPSVEVVSLEWSEKQDAEGAGASGETKAGGLGGGAVVEEEKHAVLKYVVQALNEALVIELLEGFPL
jgi:hypothetical protein